MARVKPGGGGGGEPWWVIDVHSRGFSGYEPVQSQAKPTTNPYSSYAAGPFKTQAAAEQWISKHQTHGGLPHVPNPLSSVTGFLGALSEANTWIRVGEVVLGLVLIAVGIAKLTHAVPIATKVAETAGKVL